MRGVLDPNPGLRSDAEWRRLLGGLVESFSAFTGIRFEPTSWFVRDDQPGYASACNCVDVRASLHPALGLEACGVMGITVNFGEAAWVSCDLLLFADGRRLQRPDGFDFMSFSYREVGWSSLGWAGDSTGEWESHSTDARWGGA